MQVQQTWVMPKQPIWIHRNHIFLKGIIKEVYKDIITCLLQNGDSLKVKRHDIFHRNPMPTDYTRTDLMENDLINEPEILQHLALRFEKFCIYTFVENTLIAVNPYKMIDGLYTEEKKDYYVEHLIKNLEGIKEHQPHLYSITAQAIGQLFNSQQNQAIIISGESGAGKTEANKECLRFMAHYFHKYTQGSEENIKKQTIVEKAIMLSNPILQAFGNSKTIRNNNSSRFGKFLSILVDPQQKSIKNAEIYNYLLEKSRIIVRSKDQQNFHIFYELLIKTDKADKMKYHLLDPQTNKQLTFQDFSYTKNEKLTEYLAHPEVSFERVVDSLKILPDPQTYSYVCRILSAVLHLGNLEPYEDENIDHCEIMPDQTFKIVCSLLEIEHKLLFQSLTSYSIKVGGEDLIKSFSKRQVQQLIHSLSKTLYQKLFQWLINEINILCASESKKGEQKPKLLSLGFLDIYGFQVLTMNSLEQLFINYTNQRLHQIYLKKIFKLQKQIFITEGLQHKFREVSFQDNIKVLELIDYDQLSIFNLLDEWCSVASPDESTFITKLRFNHKKHEKFPPGNLNLLSTQFMIRHSPQDVEYNVVGFREKNKDLLRQEIKITLRSSKLKILQDMFIDNAEVVQGDARNHRLRKFLSSKFRKQMNTLVNDLLSQSELNFIRCIKSNGEKKPMKVDEEVVYSQIKYLGVLDTIKIKKMGYCAKVKYEDLDKRFPWLVRHNFNQPAFPNEIKKALQNFLPRFTDEEMLFGKNRVFFKDFANTMLLKKYSKYYKTINIQAHKLTSLFIKNAYQNKRQRILSNRKTITRYLKTFLQAKDLKKKIQQVRKIQLALLDFISFKHSEKKMKSIQVVQSYIKRSLAVRQRLIRLRMVEKVILTFKRLIFKKLITKKVVIDHVVSGHIFNKAWSQIVDKNERTIQKYIKGFITRRRDRIIIKKALINEKNVISTKYLHNFQKYMKAFAERCQSRIKIRSIIKIQSFMRGKVFRKRFIILREKTIIIQRAFRDYLFRKKGAKTLFETTYKWYADSLLSQNKACRSQLYDSEQSEANQLNNSTLAFLGKFKQKISLLYYIIDFESFVDLQLVYPGNSWAQNYLEINKQCLERNDPLQFLQVGQTFTIVASTTKLFLWGMHDSYKNLQPDQYHQVKTKMPVDYFSIARNKLNFSYMKSVESDHNKKNTLSSTLLHEPKNFKIASTVSKDYNLENGRVYLCCPNELKLIQGIPSNERVVQIACGKSHVILRSTSKKVYTFGHGKEGQLGHQNRANQQKAKLVKFFESIKTAHPIQVSAGFTSSIVLMSNKKIYWFGKNGTISYQSTPTLLELKDKASMLENSSEIIPVRVLTSWSRTLGVTAITLLSFNGKFKNNNSLRNKTADVLISKWQQSNIHSINPPFNSSISDHLQQCHVKLPKNIISIQPESTKILKGMKEKVKQIQAITTMALNSSKEKMKSSKSGMEFSFANTQRGSLWK